MANNSNLLDEIFPTIDVDKCAPFPFDEEQFIEDAKAWDKKASSFNPEEEATRYDEHLRNLGCPFLN